MTVLLLSSLTSWAQDLSKFPPNYTELTDEAFCELFHTAQVEELMHVGLYEFENHDYASRLIIARLWNTVWGHTHLITSINHIVCPHFSLRSGVWNRFNNYIEHSWGTDSFYFKNDGVYILNEQGQEEFPFYRLEKSDATIKAEEAAAKAQAALAEYRNNKILSVPYDSLPNITISKLQEWLEPYFEGPFVSGIVEIQDVNTHVIQEIDIATLLVLIQGLKKKEQLLIRYAYNWNFKMVTMEQVGPILIEIL